MFNLTQLVILAAAWWHESISEFSCRIAHWPNIFFRRWISRDFFPGFETFVQDLVCFLLFVWLAWLISEDYLRDKWSAELLEASRLYDLENLGILYAGFAHVASPQKVINPNLIVCLLITGVNEKTPSEQAIEGTANAAERQPQFYRGVSAASERRLSAASEDRAEPERMEFINTENEIRINNFLEDVL